MRFFASLSIICAAVGVAFSISLPGGLLGNGGGDLSFLLVPAHLIPKLYPIVSKFSFLFHHRHLTMV